MRGVALLLIAAAPLLADDADEIMRRVGENQERAQKLRAAYVFDQDVMIRLYRGNKKLAREERHRFSVLPGEHGLRKERVSFAGRYLSGGRMIEYDHPGFRHKEMDIDGEIAEDLVEDLASDKGSRDGIAAEMFPLGPAEQAKYAFTLEGRQKYQGRDVYRVLFKPKTRDSASWSGEALIDIAEYEPVLITTWLARGVPVPVRMLLGTNLKHLGFKVTYERVGEGVWFPSAYGGEFELRVLFAYKRTISLAMRNEGFRRADVETAIQYHLN